MNNPLARLPLHASRLGWLETGAALAAIKTGGQLATRFVRRNPAVAVATVAGAGLLWLAARRHAKKREENEAADGKTRQVRARRAPRQRATR
ncbi:MAG: hypothetical protein M3Y70_02410 [Pseudomonadota bacterium]|nr:hypothetical protein [Pseudomonadota bacterium]